MSAVGKTIARIETEPTDPEYGRARDDTLLIHFTDGTALCVTGHSHEEVGLDHDEMDTAAVLRWQHAAQGRREAEHQQRLNRAGWMALSCEERAARNEAKRQRQAGPNFLIPHFFEEAVIDAIVGRGARRRRCERCREVECPNAKVAPSPTPSGPTYVAGHITIPKGLLP